VHALATAQRAKLKALQAGKHVVTH